MQTVDASPHREPKVELRLTAVDVDASHLHPRKLIAGGFVGVRQLELKEHLEERCMTEAPRRVQFGNELLERKILVGKSIEDSGADASLDCPEGGIFREIDSEGQGVGEESD